MKKQSIEDLVFILITLLLGEEDKD